LKPKFLDRPERYVPALGGDCVVCKVEMGKKVPGKPAFSHVYDGRLFLFPGQKQLEMFENNPRK
jgi:YHS domain-containing protein